MKGRGLPPRSQIDKQIKWTKRQRELCQGGESNSESAMYCAGNLKRGLLHVSSGVKVLYTQGMCSRGIFIETLLTVR